MKLNLGCGRNILDGWLNVDREPLPGVDIVADLDSELPLDAGVADEFLLSHIIEHIHKPTALMQELHRVAKPGARAVIRTPYGSSDDAWEDPTHVRPYFINSFGYFSQPFYWRADYGYRGDWQVKSIKLLVKDKTTTIAHIMRLRNTVNEMVAELAAIKPIRAPRRELQEQFPVELVCGD